MIRTRFAPSPSGRLHLGHGFSAVLAHDFARANGGEFILRIDDIDTGRSRPEHVEAIRDDLAWLGLDWDGPPHFQSQRLARYRQILETLIERGLAYPCFCTRADIAAEIAASAHAPHGPATHIYPGACRALDPVTRADRIARQPHCWRLDMARATDAAGQLVWIEGTERVAAEPTGEGDIVLARKDAPSSYHLASTIDDADFGITDVVRGRDLFAATHVQRLLQALLDLPTPTYHHHALVLGADGKRLAKRDAAAGLDTLRADGADGRKLADDLRARCFPVGYRLSDA